MKITKRQLRKIIREAMGELPREFQKKADDRYLVIRTVKDFSKIVIDQVAKLISGIEVDIDPLEVKHQAYHTLLSEIENFADELDQEYDEKIRQPRLQSSAEKASSRKANQSPRDYEEYEFEHPESQDFWDEFD